MKIFGFNFSRKGVTLPFSSIRISIPLLVVAIQAITSVRASTFPHEGSFQDQVDFVRDLPPTCSQEVTTHMHQLVDSTNPFDHLSRIPPDLKATVHRHEFDSSYGTVVRRTATNAPSASQSPDTTSVMIGGEGDGSEPVVFKFILTPQGLLRPYSKEKISLDLFSEGLKQQNVGFVVNVESDEENCFSTKNAP